MTKFQKIQRISSVIPVYSTVFVAFVTMFELKKRKAPVKLWFYFMLTFFLSGLTTWGVITFVMSGKSMILNIIVTGLILSIGNILMVELQVVAAKKQKEQVGTDRQEDISVRDEEKKTSKNKIALPIILSITISVVCSIITVAALCIFLLIIHPAKQIEDINGIDNTRLATIAIDEIVTGKHSYIAYSNSDSAEGKRTNVTERFENFDYDNVYLRSKKISGIRVLQSSNIDSDQLVLEINSEVKSGNVEFVITVDGEYYQSVAANQTCTITLSGVANKLVLVKMGAESAELEVTVVRSRGQTN